MAVAWRHLTYTAIVLPAYLPLVAVAVPGWHRYRRHYLDGWRDWLPAMTLVAALMAVVDAFSVAQGWWAFDRRYFTPPVVAGVPIAELMFFAGAVFFVRFLVVAADRLTRGRALGRPVVHRGRLLAVVGTLAGGSFLFAWFNSAHPRTLVEFGFMVVLSTLLLATTPDFWRRETWVCVGAGLVLLFVMDSVMNGLGTFTHTPGVGTGVRVFGLFPVEDIPYALTVIQLLLAAPHLWRRAEAYRRAEPPAAASAGPRPVASGEPRADR
jgi:lycopene cyclase domain-containing protein